MLEPLTIKDIYYEEDTTQFVQNGELELFRLIITETDTESMIVLDVDAAKQIVSWLNQFINESEDESIISDDEQSDLTF